MIKLIHGHNLEVKLDTEMNSADVIYCDVIYDDEPAYDVILRYKEYLKPGGLFIIQTDWHTVFEYGLLLSIAQDDFSFVNHLVWKNEWGNHPKDRFHQCFDDILVFSKTGTKHKFYPERVQVQKVTLTKGLNPSGRTTKTATAWIDGITLTTTARERIKTSDGHLIKWQKPLKLFDRILLPFTDENDLIIDPFMGSGTVAEWCKQNHRNYIGIELDDEVYNIAKQRVMSESAT